METLTDLKAEVEKKKCRTKGRREIVRRRRRKEGNGDGRGEGEGRKKQERKGNQGRGGGEGGEEREEVMIQELKLLEAEDNSLGFM